MVVDSSVHENAIMAGLLQNCDVARSLIQSLRAIGIQSESFSNVMYGKIYDTISRMIDSGYTITPASVLSAFSALSDYPRICSVIDSVMTMDCITPYDTTPDGIVVHGEALKNLWTQRIVYASVRNCAAQIKDGVNAVDIASEITAELAKVLRGSSGTMTTCEAANHIDAAWRAAASGRLIGIPTPFDRFNARTGGIPRKLVTVLCGRGGAGKSSILAQWLYVLGSGASTSCAIPALSMCFEDGIEKTLARVGAVAGGFNTWRFDTGRASQAHIDTAVAHVRRASEYPIVYDDRPMTVSQIRTRIGNAVSDHGVQIAFIDGFKDIIDDHTRWDQTRIEKYQSQHLRDTAKLYDVSLVVVHHLTKIDDDVRISSNSIRGNSLINADARMVIALQNDKGMKNFSFDLIKSNFSPLGHVDLVRDATRGIFIERDDDDDTEPQRGATTSTASTGTLPF